MSLGRSVEVNLHVVPDSEKDVKHTFKEKAKLVFSNITLEPVMVCFILPSVMSGLAMQNLHLEKACRVNLNYSKEVCDALTVRNITNYKEEEVEVQKLVAIATACKNVIHSVFPAILLLFYGSWSDRHNRRKPCILIPIFGDILMSLGFLICTYYFFELSLVFNILVESIPPAITGGWGVIFMGIFSYIAIISSDETRTLRIGAVHMFFSISVTVAIALSGILLKQIGFYGIFTLSFCMYIASFVYGYLRINDQPNENVDTKKGVITDFFDIKHVKETLKVAFKDGERNRKKRVCAIMILVMVVIGPFHEMSLRKASSIEANMSQTNPEQKDKYSFKEKMKLVFTNITLEPVMVGFILPNVMSSLAMQNLHLEKACRVNLNYSRETCDALSARNLTLYGDEEVEVQKLVATATAYKNVILSVFPAMLLMFFGSWSDRHNRRKPCILIPMVGDIFMLIGFLICTYYFYELSLVYSVLAEVVPPAITGGWSTIFMGVFSYIGAISTVETRTLRIGAVNIFFSISVTVAIALSGVLFKQMGFYGVFSLALCMYITSFIYGFFRLKDYPKEVKLKKGVIADFFDLKHIKETLRVAFKDGERNRKKRVCTIMVLVMVIIGPFHGEMAIMYLFVRYKFEWDELDYSIFSTFNFVASMIGTSFSLLIFSKYLKLDDTVVGIISNSSKILSSLVYTFAPNPTIFYMGAILEMFNGTSFIAMRSIISKLVTTDELGKINSMFGVCEALVPLVYGPMYSAIYRSTINVLPGAFYLAGGILTTPALFIFYWLYLQHKEDEKEEMLNKEQLKKLTETSDTILLNENEDNKNKLES